MSKTFEVLSGCYVIVEMTSFIVTERYNNDVIFRNVSNRGVIPLRSSSTPFGLILFEVKIFHRFLESNPRMKMRESKSVAPKPV